jgi:hypothetical protein
MNPFTEGGFWTMMLVMAIVAFLVDACSKYFGIA